jgi:DNA-binding protein YbaB
VTTPDLPTAERLKAYQEQHLARMRELQARGAAVKARLEATEISQTSRDGAVTVVVGAGGVLKKLTFGAKADGVPPSRLSAAVMATYRQACAQAAERSTEALSALVGPDNPTFQLLRDAIPPAADENGRS